MRNVPQLSNLEWQAVSVALSDAQRCGCNAGRPVGRVGRLFRALTGHRPVPALADPRLETIRRFVCEARQSRRLPEQHVPQLLQQGFNQDQISALAMLAA